MNLPWSKQVYETSVSSRCWDYTPYSAGWDKSRDYGADLSADMELAAIVAMERELPEVPGWAEEIVRRGFRLPGCPHYAFPRAFLDAVDAIGQEYCPTILHGCYTAEGRRKRRMADYMACLEAWLGDRDAQTAARQMLEGERGDDVDWGRVCADLWGVLGERTRVKRLLVERLVHRQRWWTKTLIWDDQPRVVLEAGEDPGDRAEWGDSYGNPGFRDPYMAEYGLARVQELEKELAEGCPHWPWFKEVIASSWLCAPKAFRFLEKTLWCIGKERPAISLPSYPLAEEDRVPGFLQYEGEMFDMGAAQVWWGRFMTGLRGWWRDRPTEGPVGEEVVRRLCERTAIKRWLVRLLVRQLEMLTGEWGLARLDRQA